MATTWVTLDDDMGAARPALDGGPPGPDRPGVVAPLAAAASGPAYALLASLADPAELEHLRHVALRLRLRRPGRAGERLRVTTFEVERGRLGAAVGVALVSVIEDEDGHEVARCDGWAQLGPGATAPEDAGPLAVPRAVRVGDDADSVADVVPDAAVATWLAHTGDEVPIHREGHAVHERLGGVAVPGTLLAVRVAHRAEPLLGTVPTGLEARFKRLVPSGAPLRYLVARDGADLRFAAVDADGAALASGRLLGG